MWIVDLVFLSVLIGVALHTTGWTWRTGRRLLQCGVILGICYAISLVLASLIDEADVYNPLILLLNLPVRAALLVWLSGSWRSWPALIGVPAIMLVSFLLLAVLSARLLANIDMGFQFAMGLLLTALFAMAVFFSPIRASIRPGQLLILALTAGLASTWIEYGIRWGRQLLLGPMVVVLMHDNLGYSPLLLAGLNLFIFSILGLIGSSVIWYFRSPRVAAFVAFAIAYLACLNGLATAMSLIHWFAMNLLVVGIAVTLVNSLAKNVERSVALARRALLALTLVTALTSIGLYLQPRLSEMLQQNSLPQPTAELPHIILITLDTVRLQSMSLYGYSRDTTPELQRLAQRGTLFENALTTSAWTLPTHVSLFTGRYGSEHDADWVTPLDKRYPTLAETLSQQGYATAGFVANQWMCGPSTGLNRGFAWYDYRPPWQKQASYGSFLAWFATTIFAPAPIPRKSAEDLNREFLDWLDSRPQRPVLAFLNYFDAHDPYEIPDTRFDQFSDVPIEERERIRRTWFPAPPEGWAPSGETETQVALGTYEGAIAYLDHHLGRLIGELDARGLMDNTLLIITNDHGEHFGEHGLFEHGNSLYRQLIDAPLLIIWPGHVPEGRRVEGVASLADMPATVFDLLDIEQPADVPGVSLARFWDDDRFSDTPRVRPTLIETGKTFLPDQPNSNGPISSVVADGWHYIRYEGLDTEELFDFEKDPLETVDLSQTPAGQEQLPRLRSLLDQLQNKSTIEPHNSTPDQENTLEAVPTSMPPAASQS